MIAIKLDYDDDPSLYNGPPCAVCECPIDEYDIAACSLNRHGGNSYAFADQDIERSRNCGKDDIVVYTPPQISPEERARFEAESQNTFEIMRAKWVEVKPMRDQQAAIEWNLSRPYGLPESDPHVAVAEGAVIP